MASLPVVYYAQGLEGRRWRLYAPWSKLLPSAFMDKVAVRWPARRLWQGEIACGATQVELQIYGGTAVAQGWLEKLRAGKGGRFVTSTNLTTQTNSMSLPAGRLLMASYLRQVVAELSAKMQPGDDWLTIGLAARGNEMACWLANIDGLARQVTVVTDRRSRLLPLTASGLAPRQLDFSVGSLGVDILIVAPEFVSWLQQLTLTPGTVVIRTDGAAAQILPGIKSISLSYGSVQFPAELLAQETDVFPLREAMLLTAFLGEKEAAWPTHWPGRLALMDQAVRVSEWSLTWQLVSASATEAT